MKHSYNKKSGKSYSETFDMPLFKQFYHNAAKVANKRKISNSFTTQAYTKAVPPVSTGPPT